MKTPVMRFVLAAFAACNVDLNASSGVAHAIRDPDRVEIS